MAHTIILLISLGHPCSLCVNSHTQLFPSTPPLQFLSCNSRNPRNSAIQFTQGDILPKNIIVEGSRVTGIVDWATGGFYPAHWEYCPTHDPTFRTPGWKLVLQEVFLGEPREVEINARTRELDRVLSRATRGQTIFAFDECLFYDLLVQCSLCVNTPSATVHSDPDCTTKPSGESLI